MPLERTIAGLLIRPCKVFLERRVLVEMIPYAFLCYAHAADPDDTCAKNARGRTTDFHISCFAPCIHTTIQCAVLLLLYTSYKASKMFASMSASATMPKSTADTTNGHPLSMPGMRAYCKHRRRTRQPPGSSSPSRHVARHAYLCTAYLHPCRPSGATWNKGPRWNEASEMSRATAHLGRRLRSAHTAAEKHVAARRGIQMQ